MKSSDPIVSVVLPTFNRAGLLPRAVRSVVGQTFSSWEVIIVDDGSTDETAAVASDLRADVGDRLVCAVQPHAGASVARNTGIERARGRLVAFLDSDDEFLPDKLERQVALFEQRFDLGLVFSDMSFEMVDGAWHASAFESCAGIVRSVPVEDLGDGRKMCGPDFVDYLVRRYFIPTITGMVRRDVLDDDVRFLPGQCYSEEWLFFLEVARRSRCGFIDAPLSVQHCQPGSVSLSSVWRNVDQQCRALREIRRRFPEVSRAARRAVRDQLAFCCRQLGFDAYKRGLYGDARRRFTESLTYRPGFRDAVYVLQALWRQVLPE